MKCPLIHNTEIDPGKGTRVVLVECGGAECEFYQESFKKCSITTLADALSVVVEDLDRLISLTRAGRMVFRCSQCGTTLSAIPQDIDTPETGWTRIEHTDGSRSWICRTCSEETGAVTD